MKQKVKMNVETSLRNIESSMRAEGFEFSEETCAACREILESGERAKSVAKTQCCFVLAVSSDGK